MKPKPLADRADEKAEAGTAPSIVGTDAIIAKNLFDPERGATRTKETEADTRAAQRIRSMVLLGTAILGSNRYAIVQDGDGAGRTPAGAPTAVQGPRRMKIGDSIEGFNLTEVGEKAVVFARGATRVELPIDYFRKVPVGVVSTTPQPGQPRVPGQAVPGPAPGQARDPSSYAGRGTWPARARCGSPRDSQSAATTAIANSAFGVSGSRDQ